MSPKNRVELVETQFSESESLSESLLRIRIGNASRNHLSKLLVARSNSQEVGYVVLDFWDKTVGLVLYEIFVLPGQKGRGYGTSILEEVFAIAEISDYEKVIVRPNSIESTSDKEEYEQVHERLVQWYAKMGFEDSGDGQMDRIILTM